MAPADDMVGDYRISWLAEKLHSIPRLDMSLHRVRADFQLNSQHYKEVSLRSVDTVTTSSNGAAWLYHRHRQIHTADH